MWVHNVLIESLRTEDIFGVLVRRGRLEIESTDVDVSLQLRQLEAMSMYCYDIYRMWCLPGLLAMPAMSARGYYPER